jgi:hypothetical protein
MTLPPRSAPPYNSHHCWCIRGNDGRESSDENKSLYLVFVRVVFSQHLGLFLEQLGQHLGLLLEQLGQQHLICFFRTAGQQHLDCFYNSS